MSNLFDDGGNFVDPDARPAAAPPPGTQVSPADPMGARPRLVAPPHETGMSPLKAAWLRGLDNMTLGGGELAARLGQGATSAFGLAPNPVSDAFGRGARDIRGFARDLGGAADTAIGGDKSWGTAGAELAGDLMNPLNLYLGRLTRGMSPAGAGATAGGAGGLLTPSGGGDDQSGGSYALEKLGQTGFGTATGGTLGAGLGVAGGLLAPKVKAAMKYLIDQGIKPTAFTIGQILGGPVGSVEDFVRDVLPLSGIPAAQARGESEYMLHPIRKALENIGATVPEGMPVQDALAHAQQKISDAYNTTLNNMGDITAPFYTKKNGTLSWGRGLPGQLNSAFQTAADNIVDQKYIDMLNKRMQNAVLPLFDSGWTANASKVKAVLSTLKSDARGYYNAGANGDEKALADGYQSIADKLNNFLYDNDKSGMLRKADAAHAQLQIPQGASVAARKFGGEYSPEQLIDQSYKQSPDKAVAAGAGRMQKYGTAGQEVLGKPTPLEAKLAERALAYAPMVEPLLQPQHAPVLGALYAASVPVSRALYSRPVQSALSAYATRQPGRMAGALGAMLQSSPGYLGGLQPDLQGDAMRVR